MGPLGSCLFLTFALIYAKLTSAGSPDPVTSLIPHHRRDWILPSGGVFFQMMINSKNQGL